jgi:hypothetical protein
MSPIASPCFATCTAIVRDCFTLLAAVKNAYALHTGLGNTLPEDI